MTRRAKTPVAFSDQIRQAVRDSGVTPYRISVETRINRSVLSRFLSGEYGLEMSTLDRLAAFLNLRVIADPADPKGK